MFSSRFLVPARRATLAAFQPSLAESQPLISPLHQRQPQSRRRYAVRSPRVSRSRRAPEGRLLFTPSDIPPISLWQDYLVNQRLGDLTPEDAFTTARHYCDVATRDGSAWKSALEKDFGIDPYTLHYTAIPLMHMGKGNWGHLGRHMLITASSLRYTPSTLSLIALLAGVPENDVFAKMKTHLRDAEAHLKRLVQTENDPDIFTVQGLLLLRETPTGTAALRSFDKAIEAARNLSPNTASRPASGEPTARAPIWFYEPACHHHRGLILLQRHRIDEALAAFQIAALELDFVPSYLALAQMLRRDAPERETCLLKAAQGGSFVACGLYALHWADRAADPALPKEDRVHASIMAREWAAVEPDAVRRAELESLVGQKTSGI